MTLLVNQFAQSDVQGRLDLRMPSQAMSVRLGATSAGVVAGQAVKISDVAGDVPVVLEAALAADDIFGFVMFNQIKNAYVAGDMMEILVGHDGVMYMTASAAMARGAKVAVVIASQKVKTAASGEMIVGRMLDKPTADGVLCRVMLDLPGSLAP